MTKIGIESEFPVVDNDGEVTTREAVEAVFRWLIERHGFEPYHDGMTGCLVGARKLQGESRLDVGTDYGFCTLEVAFPPEESFDSAELAWNGFLDEVLLPALASQGLSVLGYGCQPKSLAAGRPYIADKGHYQLVFYNLNRYPSPEVVDGFPSYASLQFNLDVALPKVVLATNTFIKLSPLICAWSANSPVFGGHIQPWLETRAQAYLAAADTSPIYANRFYFPRRLFTSLADYLREAWALPIYEVRRGGNIFRPLEEGLTLLEFATTTVRRKFIDLHGEVAMLDCVVDDLATGLACMWPTVRIKARMNEALTLPEILAAVEADQAELALADAGRGTFIEVRHLPALGRRETFAWLAMFLGWLANIDACAALVEEWSLEEVKACLDEVLVHGWDTCMRGRRLKQWGQEAFDLAGDSSSLIPLHQLIPLRQRLDEGTSPATDAIATFSEHGVDALVAQLKLVLPSVSSASVPGVS